MNSKFVLTQGIGQKLEFAINRNGGTAAGVEWLSSGENWKMVSDLASGEYVLSPVTKALAVAERTNVGMNLLEWFCPRDGLYFYTFESFKERVLTNARDDGTANIAKCNYIDLPHNMYDSEIITEYLGGEEEVKKCAMTMKQVQSYLNKQWGGGKGDLLVDGKANLFYVLGKDDVLYVVFAYLDGDLWFLRVWFLGEHDNWRAGHRVFRNKR